MVVKTKKGYFQVLKNVKDAFNLEIFEECYIEEWYDQFIYIVGDISDSKLRLKGFSANPAAKEYFEYIPDYLIEACNYKPAYFILKKTTEEYYNEHKDEKETEEVKATEEPVETEAEPATGEMEDQPEQTNHNEKILALYSQGKSYVEIAKELGLGQGEVRLVVGLYKGVDTSEV